MNLPIVLSSCDELNNFREIIALWNHQIFYRVENLNIDSKWVQSKKLKGTWFSPNLDYVLNYTAKNQEVPWTKLIVMAIPIDIAQDFNASNQGLAFTLNFEPNNFIIDRNNLPEDSFSLELDLDQIDDIGWNDNSKLVLDRLAYDINRILS